MEFIQLSADVRTDSGKGAARKLRQVGRMPAVLYGKGVDSVMLTVDIHELETAIRKNRGGQLFFNLEIKNGETQSRPVMLKELQTETLRGDYIHADFYEVSMDRKIWVSVPVTTTGKCKGVEMGGMLQIIRYELDVLCLPDAIPPAIGIDVTDLDIGDSVHIQDISMEGVEFDSDVNFTVLTVLGKETASDETEAGGMEGEGAEDA